MKTLRLSGRAMLHLVYDGQCRFCQRMLRVCTALDVRRRLVLHDATNRPAIVARFPELSGADFDHAMFAVTAEGAVYRGFYALRRILRESPFTWVLLPFFYLPFSGAIGQRLYGWVARNRYRLGCQSAVCEVPRAHADRPASPSA
jgi:predicted DCC family thiol-disulfide oxidoreductase YuxK